MVHRHERGGAAAVEFALILPILVTLLFGIMEYGWLFLQQSNVVTAAREGVRLGVTVAQDASPDPSSTAETRAEAVLGTLGVNTAGAAFSGAQSGASPSEVLNLTITVPYESLTGLDFLTPSNLSASMSMLLEQQD